MNINMKKKLKSDKKKNINLNEGNRTASRLSHQSFHIPKDEIDIARKSKSPLKISKSIDDSTKLHRLSSEKFKSVP